jgi:hypothetical protein
MDRVQDRPAVQRGIAVPAPPADTDDETTAEKIIEGARSMLQR